MSEVTSTLRTAPREPKKSAFARGYTKRWQAARLLFLSQPEHWYCIDCTAEGFVEPATVVDHEIPHRGDPVLFWDETNWRARCKTHHDRKTRAGQ